MSARPAPTNLRSLQDRIRNCARSRGTTEKRMQWVVANSVIAQMIPGGLVKGGTSLKIRVGEAGSRFTPDFDAVRGAHVTVDDYISGLEQRLDDGWSSFRGTVIRREPAQPKGVPPHYVMQPFDVRLLYSDAHWLTVRLELGHDEIGSTARPDHQISDDIREIFAAIGLPEPAPVPLLSVEHQIAQKIHACTAPDRSDWVNDRAHDLVDIQILRAEETVDEDLLASIAPRLFAARREHDWPPRVVTRDSWGSIYAEAADGLDVESTVDAAVRDLNEWIARLARV